MDYQAWCREMDQKEAEDSARMIRENEERKEKRCKLLADHREQNGDYWYYSAADVYVPMDMLRIPSIDRVNYIQYQIISPTEAHQFQGLVASTFPPLTQSDYHQKYCTYNEEEGKWYYTNKS